MCTLKQFIYIAIAIQYSIYTVAIYSQLYIISTYPVGTLRLYKAFLTCSTMDAPFTHINYGMYECAIHLIVSKQKLFMYLNSLTASIQSPSSY